jgi:hypothetical protein
MVSSSTNITTSEAASKAVCIAVEEMTDEQLRFNMSSSLRCRMTFIPSKVSWKEPKYVSGRFRNDSRTPVGSGLPLSLGANFLIAPGRLPSNSSSSARIESNVDKRLKYAEGWLADLTVMKLFRSLPSVQNLGIHLLVDDRDETAICGESL